MTTRVQTDAVLQSRNYTGRDFYTIVQDLQRYVKAVRPEDINSFFEGDIAKILIELLAFTGDGLHYAIDRVSEEAWLATARLRASALRHAATLAYQVSTSSSSGVMLVPESYASIPLEVTQRASACAVQRLTLAGAPTSGTFTLTFQSETTVPLAYNFGPQAVEEALIALSAIGEGNVSVEGDAGGPWAISFQGALSWSDQPAISVTNSTLKRNEKQTLTISGSPVGGTFTLTYAGQTTLPLAHDVDNEDLQLALTNLGNIGNDDVSVTGGPLPAVPVVVEFTGALASTDVQLLTAGNSLSGGSTPAITIVETVKGGVISPTVTGIVQGKNGTYNITFTKGQSFSVADRAWEVSEDTTIYGIEVGEDTYADVFQIPVVEGRSFSETFQSDGSRFQTFTTTSVLVIGDTFEVRVGDPTGTPWTPVATLAMAGGGDTAYTVRYDDYGRAIFGFGDNVTGKAPNDGQTIFVSGRLGGGTAGNVNANAIHTTISGTATGGPLGLISLGVPLTNVVAAAGGRDAETLAEMQRNIPAWIRTVDKATTKEDYDTLAGQFESTNGAVGRAAAYLATAAILYQVSGDSVTAENPLAIASGSQITFGNRVFQFSKDFETSETDPILWFNPNTVRVYAWVPSDRGFTGASASLLADLREYLQMRSVVTATIIAYSGRNKVVNLRLGDITYFSTHAKAEVEESMISAIKAFFLSDAVQPGQPLRLSDLYGAIESVEGIDHFVTQTPTDDVVLGKDEMPYLGVLTYTLVPKQAPRDDVNRTTFDGELFV